MSCEVAVSDSKNPSLGWIGTGNAGPTGSAGPPNLTSATVTFSPSRFVTGTSKTDPDSIYVPGTATVTPKDLVQKVNIDNFVTLSGGSGSAGVKQNPQVNTSTGQIKFNLYGKTGTAKSMPNGDVEMEAKDGTTVLGTAMVIIKIPAAIGTPHPTFNGAVAGTNKVLSGTTTPAWWGLGAGQVELVTWAGTIQKIKVIDQFGDTLSSIYNGQEVQENGSGSFLPINQKIENGYYSDPVGLGVKAFSTPQDPNPCLAASQEARNWPNAAPLAIPNSGPNSVDWQVQVAGFTLNPGITNRSVSYNNGTLIITWP